MPCKECFSTYGFRLYFLCRGDQAIRESTWIDAIMQLRSVIDALGRNALFALLSESERAEIAGRMRRMVYDPDQMIFARGDPGLAIYLVLDGRVRLSILTQDGSELSFAHARPGDIFGEIAALDGGERTAGATAITRVEAMTLSRRATIEFLCSRLRETDQRLEAIALHRIEVRLARLFLSALQLESPAAKGSNVPLALGMSQTELALLIGATRPKVNAALAMLQDMGAITRKGGDLRCDTSVLQSIADVE